MKKPKPCITLSQFAARVYYISLAFSDPRCVLTQCNTELRRLYLLIIVL